MSAAHPTQLYYGASVKAWRALLNQHGYSFITVDTNGVNAVFVDPARFEKSFLDNVSGVNFAENFYQAHTFGFGWEKQFKRIEMMPLETVE